AAAVLRNAGVDLRHVRLQVEMIVQAGPDAVTMGTLPQTPRAKKVIEYAIDEARKLGQSAIGTEHLLLGLLREDEGVAAQVLLNLGLKLEDVRAQLLGGLAGNRYPQRGVMFTDRARKVIQLGNQESLRLGHEYIATVDLLFGLLKEAES